MIRYFDMTLIKVDVEAPSVERSSSFRKHFWIRRLSLSGHNIISRLFFSLVGLLSEKRAFDRKQNKWMYLRNPYLVDPLLLRIC